MQIKAILVSENKDTLSLLLFYFQENNLSFTDFLLLTGRANVRGNLEISNPPTLEKVKLMYFSCSVISMVSLKNINSCSMLDKREKRDH